MQSHLNVKYGTPRARVLAAMNGEMVSPVPFDIFLNYIYPDLASELYRSFNLAETDTEGLLRALDAHLRCGKPLYNGPPLEELPHIPPAAPATMVFRGIWGTLEGIETWSEVFEHPLQYAETTADIHAHPWPDPDWMDYTRLGWFSDTPANYLPVAQWADKYRNFARWVTDWQPLFSRLMDLFGMQAGLMNMAQRPDLIEAATAHIADYLEEYYQRLAASVQGQADILGFGDDFAGQQGLIMSPRMWRRYFLPVWKRLFPIAHQYGMKASLHSCGAVRAVLGDLIDAGLDMLEVTQVTAEGMDAAAIKNDFGSHLTFYGGLDIQSILNLGTPEQVRTEVRRLIDILGKDGRYILTSCHFLLDDIPAENVLAMHAEARSHVPIWAT
jgi:uroporphyrinogen decarboxylase